MFRLKLPTDPRWANIAEGNLEEILTDHAWCELKAASNAIMLINLLPEFTEITELPSYTVTYTGSDGTEKSTTLTATDHYLTGEATAPKDVTILGGKTGTTEVAGNCLAILTQNAYGKTFVSIVMGAATKELL